jgi:ubiquitin-conjugating enzyme E2 T
MLSTENKIPSMAARHSRITRELYMLANDPGPGISAWPADESNMMLLQAQIQGPQESPYQGGLYNLTIDIPDRYPFEPPRVRFMTPIYHPNIDSDGRICLDTLKMQPHGSWSPSVNINTLLLTIRVLMSNPNADDGLVPDITEEYKRDIALWRRKASDHTKLNAVPKPGEQLRLPFTVGVQPVVDTSSQKSLAPLPTSGDAVEIGSDSGDEESDDDDSYESQDGKADIVSSGGKRQALPNHDENDERLRKAPKLD